MPIADVVRSLTTGEAHEEAVLRRTGIDGRGVGELCRALYDNCAVRTLDLRGNQIGDRGMTAFARPWSERGEMRGAGCAPRRLADVVRVSAERAQPCAKASKC